MDQSHNSEETLSLCASDLVKLLFATLLVHSLVHLEQVYSGLVTPGAVGQGQGTSLRAGRPQRLTLSFEGGVRGGQVGKGSL